MMDHSLSAEGTANHEQAVIDLRELFGDRYRVLNEARHARGFLAERPENDLETHATTLGDSEATEGGDA